MDISFVALSITAAASTSGRVRAAEECDLMEYIRAVMEYGLSVNDDHHGDSAVELAAYHGLSHALIMLLDEGCPLRKVTSQRNAIHAAVRNGQHAALEIILSRRGSEARQVVQGEEMGGGGLLFTSLIMEVIAKGDAVSAQLLLANGCASMSDMDAKCIHKRRLHKKLETLLHALYPSIHDVMHWRGRLHWSFPKTDRNTLNWLWHILQRPSNTEVLPAEMWLRVFRFFGRGWFACRRYSSIGSSGGDVLQRNIIEPTT